MSNAYNPVVTQNTDWIFQITATSGGVATDLTGYSVVLQVRSEIDNSVVLTLAIGSGVTVANPTNGTAVFRATKAQTLAIVSGFYTYGIVATAGGVGGIATTWYAGTVIFKPVTVQ